MALVNLNCRTGWCRRRRQAENPRDGGQATLAHFINYLMKTMAGCGMQCKPPSHVTFSGGNNTMQQVRKLCVLLMLGQP